MLKTIFEIIDSFIQIFGYINIEKVKIKDGYKKPRLKKLEYKKDFYRNNKMLPEIILNRNNVLVDGFCSYYIAKVWNIKYLKFRRCK